MISNKRHQRTISLAQTNIPSFRLRYRHVVSKELIISDKFSIQ